MADFYQLPRQSQSMDCEDIQREIVLNADSNHLRAFLENLHSLHTRKELCDVVLECEGEQISAHKVVLAASIEYFQSMFRFHSMSNDSEHQEVIIIQGISADALKLIIHFTYTGEIKMNRENVKDLLQAANFLGVIFVRNACEDFLVKEITMENCLNLRQFADDLGCTRLLQAINEFMLENFSRIRKIPEFLEITPNNLIELLKSDDLNVHKEEEVFESVMTWISHNVQERIRFLPDLLKEIRLLHMSLDFFLNQVKRDQLIQSCSESQKLIIEATSQFLHLFNSQQAQPSQHPSVIRDNANPIPQISQENLFLYNQCRPRKLAAGVIFCVGGRGSRLDPFRSVEVYDWRKNCWLQTSDLIIGRRHVGVVSVNNKIFAIGGHDGVAHLSSVECFDIASGIWSQVAPLATARRGMAVGALGSAIYAVGGLDDSICYKTVERYDIESDSWTEVAHMNVERGGVAVATYGGYLYAVGGNNGTSSLDSCERYDPLLNKWTRIASMRNRRAGAGIAVVDSYLYVIGGFDDDSPLSSCERYDFASNTWSFLPELSCARGGVGVAAMGGRIFAVGGHDGKIYLNTVEAFDPLSNSWYPVASISQCRAGAGITWSNRAIDEIPCVIPREKKERNQPTQGVIYPPMNPSASGFLSGPNLNNAQSR